MRKIGLLALALVLALGTMGVGLAWWSDTLFIEGSIETGTLSAEFAGNECTADDAIEVQCVTDGKTATITIGNMYPSGTATCSLTLANTGSIPAKIGSIVVDPDPAALDIDVEGIDEGTTIIPIEGSVDVTVSVHGVPGELVESASYAFTVTIGVIQFNE